jgi:hypothetical protein
MPPGPWTSPATPPLSLRRSAGIGGSALSSFEFWSSLDLSFPLFFFFWNGQPYETPNEGGFPLLEKWFARAKARAGQIQSLELNLSRKDFYFLRQNSLAFPSLRRLAIISKGVPSDYWSSSKTRRPYRHSESGTSQARLPPSTHCIELRRPTPLATHRSLLQEIPRLSHLTATVDDLSTLSDNRLTTAPHLKSLILRGPGLEYLTLSGLRRLELEMGAVPQFPVLAAFLKSSRPPPSSFGKHSRTEEIYSGCAIAHIVEHRC